MHVIFIVVLHQESWQSRQGIVRVNLPGTKRQSCQSWKISPGMGYTMVHMVYWKIYGYDGYDNRKKKNGPSRCWLLAKLHRAPGIFSCLLVKTLGDRSQRWTQRNAVKLPKIRSVFSKDTMVKQHESELVCARVKKQTESSNIKTGICVYIAYYIYIILCMYHIIQKQSLNIAIQLCCVFGFFGIEIPPSFFFRLLKAPDWAPHNSMHPSSKL